MLVRLILLLVVGFLIYTVFQALKQALSRPSAPPPEKTVRGENMVQDPECGIYVPQRDAVSLQAGKTLHHFCSNACRDKFLARTNKDQKT